MHVKAMKQFFIHIKGTKYNDIVVHDLLHKAKYLLDYIDVDYGQDLNKSKLTA